MAMQHSEYLSAKETLKALAKQLKRDHKGDRALINQTLNDTCDALLRDLSRHVSEAQYKLYESWLPSFTADLHPK